jgi:hypothetical protein
MSNALYPKFKEYLLDVLLTSTVKVQLIDTANYTYSASHQYLSDIPAGARVGAPVTLSSKAATNGVFDSADPTWTGLTGAPSIEAVVYYIDTGVEATSRLVYFLDTATGLPVSAGSTGGTLVQDNGANKIFAL